jgi:phosphohistidine phosphatase SixA
VAGDESAAAGHAPGHGAEAAELLPLVQYLPLKIDDRLNVFGERLGLLIANVIGMASPNRRAFLGAITGLVVSHAIGLRSASSGPALVMLMRHGEDIGEKSFHLNKQGMERAQALPKLFGTRLPKPDVIIATHATKGSNRPIETVEPLSRALHVPIDNRYRDEDFAALAGALLNDERYAGKVILVCWHHGKIDNLAKALGVKNAPRWPDAQFDRIWMFDFKMHGRPRFEEVHQQLLPGDR